MTEEQAKKKWCPMVRFHVVGGNVWSNEYGDGEPSQDSTKCIASECMMWREIRTSSGYKFSEPNEDGMVTCLEGPEIIGGYCGLGGKP